MMKLKVVNDYRKYVVLESDTIGNLKARIMDYFSFKEEDLSERVLVPDGRDMFANRNTRIIDKCFDLLELDDGSILHDLDGLNDGDTLLIGWKGPFIVRFLSPTLREAEAFDILVDCYSTIGDLKQKLEKATDEPVTRDNLPEMLFNADDNKLLIYFGFYRFFKITSGYIKLRIYRNRTNKIPDRYWDVPKYAYYEKDGRRLGVRYFDDKEPKYVKYNSILKEA